MKLLFILLLAAITTSAEAQKITGIAKDAQGMALTGATVSLLKAKDSSIVKIALSGDKGIYTFNNIKEGNYLVNISHVGYLPSYSKAMTVSTADVTVPDFAIAKATGDMQGVMVTARKPLVEVRADKMVLNVEGTMNATGSDALELMRRSPGVTVDKDDNLSLAGKNGVQVFIDGRPTPLSGQDLANYLKTLQSSQIEAIEIITNPSAKYEAAGNAGIINIRLKKNKAFGTNGSANLGYSVGVFSRYNGGLNLNYRNKNINLYGTYSITKGLNNSSTNLTRTVLDTLFNQKGNTVMDITSHNFKAGADYTLNKTSSIGAIINGTIADIAINTGSSNDISYIPTKTTSRILQAKGNSILDRNNYNFNVNYNYNGSGGRSFVLNADKGYYDLNNTQFQPNVYYDATGNNKLSSVTYEMHSPTEINIHSVKADYEQDFQKGKLGVGGKIAFINTDNDFKRYDVLSSGSQLDRDRSNRFTYKENINAAYVTYNRPFKGFMVQGGLRMENTTTEGNSNGLKKNGSAYEPFSTSFKRNYLDFFPSAGITFNKNPMNQWSVTFSSRIDRPAYQDLNPFEFKLDEYTSMKGNIDLRPQYTKSFGVTNTYKYKLNTSLNYSHVSDLFTQVLDTVERSKAFNSKRNLASQDITSLNISYPFIHKNLTVFGNLNTFYTMYKADFGNGRKIDLNAFGLSFVTQSSLKFAKTYTAEMTTFYNAPSIYQGTFKAKSLWSVDAGLTKQILQGKGTIKAAVSDVFHSLKFNGTSDFAGQKTVVDARWEAQQFKLNFSFRFGSNTVKAAKQKASGAEDELKRVGQDGGGIGIGKQ